MPGRTPQNAVDDFLRPLREAVRVLDGHCQFVIPRKGGFHKDVDYMWTLNSPKGMHLGTWGNFQAQMQFRIIDADREQHDAPLRVTTLGYRYHHRRPDGTDSWRIHWHPHGRSPVKGPHLHLPPTYDEHLPTGRITFEKAIAWCVDWGAPLRYGRQEALDRLAGAEAPHMLYRTWSDHPLQANAAQSSE